MSITLILGGACSGKSSRAEALALAAGVPVTYIATAPHIAGDDEWQERIEQHRDRRCSEWKTVEEELELAAVIENRAESGVLLVDCLTLWLSNLMFVRKDVESEVDRLCKLLSGLQADVILVANEVGMGLVPENAEGRAFRDAQGRLNRAVAAVADRVEFVAAGLPLLLKGENR